MPKSRKQQLHRKVAQAYHHCEETLKNVVWLHSEFDEAHPEYAVILDLIAQNVLMTEAWIKDFSMKAWNRWPSDYTQWLQ